MAKAIANNCECNENNSALTQAMMVQGMIKAVHKAIEPQCNKISDALEIVKLIEAICTKSGCNCS